MHNLWQNLIINSSSKAHEMLQHCYHHKSNDPLHKANGQCTAEALPAPALNFACIKSVFIQFSNFWKDCKMSALPTMKTGLLLESVSQENSCSEGKHSHW